MPEPRTLVLGDTFEFYPDMSFSRVSRAPLPATSAAIGGRPSKVRFILADDPGWAATATNHSTAFHETPYTVIIR